MSILRRLRHLISKPTASRFTGDFKSWDEAKAHSTGYDAPEILEKTRTALLKVRAGKAAFERDSAAFDKIEYDFPVLAGLLRAAAHDNRLNVLDFGGSLGGTYFQCRNYLSAVGNLRWNVVEQPAHVACGMREFANEELHFYETVDDCLRDQRPNVLLLSGVLQYLPNPYPFLSDLLGRDIPNVIVTRTAFHEPSRDRLTIQHVPPSLYDATYPAWFLDETTFLKLFHARYDLTCRYKCDEHVQLQGGRAVFKGFQFERKNG